MFKKILFAASVCLICSSLVHAGIINVDLNSVSTATYSGAGAAPDGANTFWNGVNLPASGTTFTTTANSLKYSDGTATATGVSFSLGNSFNSGTIAQGYVSVALNLFRDYAYDTTNSNATFTSFAINGLNTGAVYNLYIYSMADYGGSGGNTLFTIDGISGGTLLTGNPNGDGVGASFVQSTTGVSTGTNNGNYAIYSNLTAPSGTISGTFNGTNERFNGFQLEVFLPEPSSAALIGIAVVGLSARARRR
jgi:hypothetical protein